jgi:hypothetical protein
MVDLHELEPLDLPQRPRLVACATGDGVTSVVPRAASIDSRGIASRGRHVRIVCFFPSGTHLAASSSSPLRRRSPIRVRSNFEG